MKRCMKSPRRSRRRTGKEFREKRKEASLTQEDLADIFGIHTITISRWENGHGAIPEMAWLALEKVTAPS